MFFPFFLRDIFLKVNPNKGICGSVFIPLVGKNSYGRMTRRATPDYGILKWGSKGVETRYLIFPMAS